MVVVFFFVIACHYILFSWYFFLCHFSMSMLSTLHFSLFFWCVNYIKHVGPLGSIWRKIFKMWLARRNHCQNDRNILNNSWLNGLGDLNGSPQHLYNFYRLQTSNVLGNENLKMQLGRRQHCQIDYNIMNNRWLNGIEDLKGGPIHCWQVFL